MIIPIKCFTCGKVLADCYLAYLRMIREKKMKQNMEINEVIYLTKTNVDKTPEGETLDELKITKPCCRRHMLTHVDIE